jgi:serine/threonine-protein kinase
MISRKAKRWGSRDASRCDLDVRELLLDDKERARLRDQARRWLRAEVAAWGKRLDSDRAAKASAMDALKRWRTDPDLAGLRDPAELEGMTPAERQEYRDLWRDHDALLKRTLDSK